SQPGRIGAAPRHQRWRSHFAGRYQYREARCRAHRRRGAGRSGGGGGQDRPAHPAGRLAAVGQRSGHAAAGPARRHRAAGGAQRRAGGAHERSRAVRCRRERAGFGGKFLFAPGGAGDRRSERDRCGVQI
ncbi:hypothetical protein XPN_1590, partial [Xanthomonas arboricola pv. pruni MAFF 301427]